MCAADLPTPHVYDVEPTRSKSKHLIPYRQAVYRPAKRHVHNSELFKDPWQLFPFVAHTTIGSDREPSVFLYDTSPIAVITATLLEKFQRVPRLGLLGPIAEELYQACTNSPRNALVEK
jgi:hypothetical protein